MKNLSTLFVATVVMITGASLLNAQNTTSGNSWGSYSQGQTTGQKSTTNNSSTTNQINPTQPITVPSNLPEGYSEPRGKKYLTWTDEEIAQKIRWAIRDDKTLSPLAKSTEVTVKNNNVTFNGAVKSNEEKNRIATIARQTDGVKSVSNNLSVTSR